MFKMLKTVFQQAISAGFQGITVKLSASLRAGR